MYSGNHGHRFLPLTDLLFPKALESLRKSTEERAWILMSHISNCIGWKLF